MTSDETFRGWNWIESMGSDRKLSEITQLSVCCPRAASWDRLMRNRVAFRLGNTHDIASLALREDKNRENALRRSYHPV